jgi:hypothetical protein
LFDVDEAKILRNHSVVYPYSIFTGLYPTNKG